MMPRAGTGRAVSAAMPAVAPPPQVHFCGLLRQPILGVGPPLGLVGTVLLPNEPGTPEVVVVVPWTAPGLARADG
jgi:hypothetical protein